MAKTLRRCLLAFATTGVIAVFLGVLPSAAQTVGGGVSSAFAIVPTGATVTPLAAPGSSLLPLHNGLRADDNADPTIGVASSLSPDGTTLLVMTSGENAYFYNYAGVPFQFPVLDPRTGVPTPYGCANPGYPITSTSGCYNYEWIFVYDVRYGRVNKIQQINLPDTYQGLAWDPRGGRFWVSAGIDDRVYAYRATFKYPGVGPLPTYVEDAPFVLLGHNSNQTAPIPSYNGGLLKNSAASIAAGDNPYTGFPPFLASGAVVAGIALSGNGHVLAAANWENDSVSVADAPTRLVTKEYHFTNVGLGNPARGEFPYGVAILSDKSGNPIKIYVSSQRDSQVIAVRPGGALTVIPTGPAGSQPNNVLLSHDQKWLFVANGNDDSIAVINTTSDTLARKISVSRAGDPYKGANPNSLALSPNGKTLYVTLGGYNAVAVVDVPSGSVLGRIPTGWYPNSVSVSADGSTLYVVNGKSNAGPNPNNSYVYGQCGTSSDCPPAGVTNPTNKNEYDWNVEKTSLSVIPVPTGGSLTYLTAIVDLNNGVYNRGPNALMAYLHTKIQHVIYIVGENRTYDQILGDLTIGNSYGPYNQFPRAVAPNSHALAETFVDLDNYYSVGETSGVGWDWTLQGYDTDSVEKSQVVLYGNADYYGLTYDYQGTNRNINVGLPQVSGSPNQFTVRETGLLDPSGSSSILAGSQDNNAPENAGNLNPGAVGGYLWDEALRRGLTFRNYGMDADEAYYSAPPPLFIPITRTPYASHIPQAPPTKAVLIANSDVYFRGFDQKAPDTYGFEEWNREFRNYVKHGNLPNLETIYLHHDHFGSFGSAVEGLNVPWLQFADDDWAFGQYVEAISHSPYWKNTLIIRIEDDSQNGVDHVDAHRSIGYLVSPYVRRGAVVSQLYTTDSALRTIEDILGMNHLSLNDADAPTMAAAFQAVPNLTPYTAVVPGNLCEPPVAPDLVPRCKDPYTPKTRALRLLHDGAWWARMTRGMDFNRPDHLDSERFNRILWRGLRSDVPYPSNRSGTDVGDYGAQLLASGGYQTADR
ncbi:MAG: beta-propeller fold lactonase family protein [Candidatus Eremiobacteraeota bacterium]|nr:beta-propeller fold lactonase family protein [Candidatus Eremiobacteraeota bacterium]MBV8203511.1 beta-propeller fold lactonase family protein [Candidatus Eremiobacteraeota bacterium]MBV8339207.1 beta-propeller fold lactonase family protein [Candidatus Eremiobacteraeota bacterium]MBV8459360.1 beta-propeller fold lactonase family protein [Candidatus Eremiobacteraeota bacterium]MBV8596600.1 beta-propeller fold lactonase family protein [Candidatus Eremiobacteraeota bacterium]